MQTSIQCTRDGRAVGAPSSSGAYSSGAVSDISYQLVWLNPAIKGCDHFYLALAIALRIFDKKS